jgi:hypothetical protein
MNRSREEILESRRRLKTEYGQLFDSVTALLFRHDPVGINFGNNTDEYEPEAETILPRLRTCQSADDVRDIVHEEFVRWFGESAGSPSAYTQIAVEIWKTWQEAEIRKQAERA